MRISALGSANPLAHGQAPLDDGEAEARKERLGRQADVSAQRTQAPVQRLGMQALHQRPAYALAGPLAADEEMVDVAVALHVGVAHDAPALLRDERLEGLHPPRPGGLVDVLGRPGVQLFGRIVAAGDKVDGRAVHSQQGGFGAGAKGANVHGAIKPSETPAPPLGAAQTDMSQINLKPLLGNRQQLSLQ